MRHQPRPIVHESVITKAAAEIRRFIDAAKLKPDEALPPETHLSKMLGISRNSVREALRILDGLGFVQKLPGKRVVAKSPAAIRLQEPATGLDETQVACALEVAHEIRILVEERCVELAADRHDDADIAQVDSHLASFAEALKRHDYSAASHAHEEFHRAVVLAGNNPMLTSLFDAARRVESDVLRRGRETFKDRRQLPLHAAIVNMIRVGDARGAVRAIRKHFQTTAPLVEFLSKEEGAASALRRPPTR